MRWTLGAENQERTGTGAGPSGVVHAVDPTAGQTACGRPVRSLQLWADLPWRRVGMLGLDCCPVCLADAVD